MFSLKSIASAKIFQGIFALSSAAFAFRYSAVFPQIELMEGGGGLGALVYAGIEACLFSTSSRMECTRSLMHYVGGEH